MEPQTKSFDAVAESRKWREATSLELNAMSREQRLTYLHQEAEKLRAQLRTAQLESTALH